MNPLRLGFIGTGRIARALIGGLSRRDNTQIFGFDAQAETLAAIATDYSVQPCNSIEEIAQTAEVIILAVKPYQIADVLTQLNASLTPQHLLISVAAGISTTFIATHCNAKSKIIRVMPNTPMMIGKGMTALTRGSNANNDDLALAVELFNAVGTTVVVDEALMDGVTAISGSGPAYMFSMLDAFAQGGEQCGLSYNDALLLAAQTMVGAATMAMTAAKSPQELIKEVTTPGGTTEAGLKVMATHHIQQILQETVVAAATRSRELMK